MIGIILVPLGQGTWNQNLRRVHQQRTARATAKLLQHTMHDQGAEHIVLCGVCVVMVVLVHAPSVVHWDL